MKTLIASILMISSFSVFAQDCTDMTSTYDVRLCLSNELEKADADLNKQYKLCMNKLDKVAQGKLKTAQKAWISFRDAECEYQADEMRGGTYEVVIALGCHVSETKERAEELKDCVELR